MIPLVLALDPGSVVATIIFTISIISYFYSAIQGISANAAKNKPQKKEGPRSDLENLLNQFLGDQKKTQQGKSERQQQRPPKPPGNRSQSKQNPANKRPAEQQKPVQSRKVIKTSEPTLPTAQLGQGVRTHHLGNRVNEAVEKEIVEKVKSDLGDSYSAVAGRSGADVHPLVKAIRDPEGIRQAILLNEILMPPRSRRQK